MTATAPLHFEREGWSEGLERIAGVDEAGYGPLAGPVVAAAVALHPDQSIDGARDSKLLSPERREELADVIRRDALAWALGAASCRKVETLNARGAAMLAMRRAVHRLPFVADRLLVDGLPVPSLGEHRPLIRGDRRSQSIACASILAKVTRDHIMHRLHPRYPEYGWLTNHGYGTSEHRTALSRHGPTPHHRRTFAAVLQIEMRWEAGEAGMVDEDPGR